MASGSTIALVALAVLLVLAVVGVGLYLVLKPASAAPFAPGAFYDPVRTQRRMSVAEQLEDRRRFAGLLNEYGVDPAAPAMNAAYASDLVGVDQDGETDLENMSGFTGTTDDINWISERLEAGTRAPEAQEQQDAFYARVASMFGAPHGFDNIDELATMRQVQPYGPFALGRLGAAPAVVNPSFIQETDAEQLAALRSGNSMETVEW